MTVSEHMKHLEPVCEAIWIWLCGGQSSTPNSTSSSASATSSSLASPGTALLDVSKMLQSELEWERYFATFSMALRGSLSLLVERLENEDEQLAINSALALACTPHTAACATLVLQFLKKPGISDSNKASAIYILGQLGAKSQEALLPIVKCMEESKYDFFLF